jgi:hypothetical protein
MLVNAETVIPLDVDNTLLDNDRFAADLIVACSGDLLDLNVGQFHAAGTTRAAAAKEQHA